MQRSWPGGESAVGCTLWRTGSASGVRASFPLFTAPVRPLMVAMQRSDGLLDEREMRVVPVGVQS